MAPVLVKSLNRLSRSSLTSLAFTWLQQHQSCQPYLANNRSLNETDEEDYLFLPAEDVVTLREIYRELKLEEKEVSKRDIIDRIVDGDWRRGLTLHQLATIDFAYLEQNDTALKWSALKLVPLEDEGEHEQSAKKRRKLSNSRSTTTYPNITPATFVSALKSEISPLVKAHYHLHRLPSPANLSILRLYISPQSCFEPKRSSRPTDIKHATDVSRVLYIALPDSCPYIYIALSGSTKVETSGQKDVKGRIPTKIDMAAMKRVVLEAIPKAMSKPQQRWSLESTKLTTKSLRSISALRGNQKPGTSGGAYSMFVTTDESKFDLSPLNVQLKATDEKDVRGKQIDVRFGRMQGPYHASLDRFHITIDDLTQSENKARSTDDAAPININFSGTDVFLGLRKLAELGDEYVDLTKMPAWMTGEIGVSSFQA